MRTGLALAIVTAACLAPPAARAHQSFAAYFDPAKSVTVIGTAPFGTTDAG